VYDLTAVLGFICQIHSIQSALGRNISPDQGGSLLRWIGYSNSALNFRMNWELLYFERNWISI